MRRWPEAFPVLVHRKHSNRSNLELQISSEDRHGTPTWIMFVFGGVGTWWIQGYRLSTLKSVELIGWRNRSNSFQIDGSVASSSDVVFRLKDEMHRVQVSIISNLFHLLPSPIVLQRLNFARSQSNPPPKKTPTARHRNEARMCRGGRWMQSWRSLVSDLYLEDSANSWCYPSSHNHGSGKSGGGDFPLHGRKGIQMFGFQNLIYNHIIKQRRHSLEILLMLWINTEHQACPSHWSLSAGSNLRVKLPWTSWRTTFTSKIVDIWPQRASLENMYACAEGGREGEREREEVNVGGEI